MSLVLCLIETQHPERSSYVHITRLASDKLLKESTRNSSIKFMNKSSSIIVVDILHNCLGCFLLGGMMMMDDDVWWWIMMESKDRICSSDFHVLRSILAEYAVMTENTCLVWEKRCCIVVEYSITENTSFLEAAFSAASINRSFSSYVHDRLSRARYNISYVTAEKETGYIIGQVSMFVHVDTVIEVQILFRIIKLLLP